MTKAVLACLALAASLSAAAASSAATPASSAPPAAAPPSVSSNWAGYVATGPGSTASTASSSMSYTDVTGQWVEPKAICTGAASSVALWVGLGGYSTNSQELEQAGSSADCHPNGKASYYVWYELVPANAVNIKLKISPGDVIASTVLAKGGQILVQITDRTRRTRFTKRLPMATPDLTSAEWIAEAPAECSSSNSCQQLPLTDFGTVDFVRSYAIGNGVPGTITSPSWTVSGIQLVPRARRFYGGPSDSTGAGVGAGAMPLPLTPDGSGFTIDWRADAGP